MKTRLLLITSAVLFMCFIVLAGYVFRASFRQPAAYKQMSSFFPTRPLVYFQCTRLASRLKDFSQRDSYQAFLQSRLFSHIQDTVWWQELAVFWQDSLQGMPIDPLQVVGNDIALGLYQSQEGRGMPDILVMTKLDQVVKFGERILYLIDMISWQIGIHEQFEVEGIPVYQIQNKDLLFPLYYSIIGDLGLFSTSISLLEDTMLQTLGKKPKRHTEQVEETQAVEHFAQRINTTQDQRFVTLYGNVPQIVDELEQSQLWDPQQLFDESVANSFTAFPVLQFAVDISAQSLMLSLEMFPASSSRGEQEEIQEIVNENSIAKLVTNSPQAYPLLAAVKRTQFEPFFLTLEHLFPQQSWQAALRWNTQQALIWGDILECRLSTELFGTVYPVPDFSCMLATRHSERATAMLEFTIRSVFERFIPSAIQRRTMVSADQDSYRNFALSIWRVFFQEVLAYAVPQQTSQPQMSVLATNTETLNTLLDGLVNHSIPESMTGIPPIFFNSSAPSLSIGGLLIRTDRLLELLDVLSQTTTFSLLVPQKTYPEFYHTLSVLRQSEAALPDVIFVSLHVDEMKSLAFQITFWKS